MAKKVPSSPASQIAKQWYEEAVPIDSVQPHPMNPRLGDVDMIAESIAENGFYGSLKVQASSRLIIGGNHSWKAAKQEGLTHVPVTFIDCDDPTALRILAVDNRANDLAGYSDEALARLLDRMANQDGSLAGTGYVQEDFDELIERLGDGVLGGANGGDLAGALGGGDGGGAGETLAPRLDLTKNPKEKLDGYNNGTVRQIMLVMNATQYDQVLTKLKQIATAHDLDTNLDVVLYLLDAYFAGDLGAAEADDEGDADTGYDDDGSDDLGDE